MSIKKVTIIGSGNAAEALGLFFKKIEIEIVQVNSRNSTTGKKLAKKIKATFCDEIKSLNYHNGVFLLAVPDSEIPKVAKSLPDKIKNNSIVVHCSGATPSTVLKRSCKNFGVFYPLQTFTKNRSVNSRDIPFCICASAVGVERKLIRLAKKLSQTALIVSDSERKKLHLSAVFINNFTNHLLTLVYDYTSREKLDFDLLKPLLQETIKKAIQHRPKNAQTGPAKRGDQASIEQHKKLMRKYPALESVYDNMTKSIFDFYKK